MNSSSTPKTTDPTVAMPGPWEVVWLKGDRLGSPSEVRVEGTCNRVAFLASDGNLGTARLIAAAPDMLAALQTVYQEGNGHDEFETSTWTAIAAAIEKATGSKA